RSRSLGQHDVAYPRALLPPKTPELEPLRGPRAVSRDDVPELVPVGLGVLPDAVVALAQLCVGHRQPELPDLRDVPVEELLPRLLVPLRLDPPPDDRVVVRRNRVAVEHH